MQIIGLLLLGVAAGIAGGLVGIGGGIIVIPALVYLFQFSQHRAQGTTLAMLVPPIGILAAWAYYRNGLVDIRAALLLCSGFLVGGFVGARFSLGLSEHMLQRTFGVGLFAISLHMIFSR